MKNSNPKRKKSLKKNIITLVVAIVVILATYFTAWYQLYSKAEINYKQAEFFYNASDYMSALKGETIVTNNEQGYIFKSGYEQVVNIFESRYAYPKPGIYEEAKKKINTIVYTKLTPELGVEIYKKFFQIDNQYLGAVLIQSGKLFLKKRMKKDAENAFNLAAESFPLNDNIYNTAEKYLTTIKNSKS